MRLVGLVESSGLSLVGLAGRFQRVQRVRVSRLNGV